jgi:hypothetical protein
MQGDNMVENDFKNDRADIGEVNFYYIQSLNVAASMSMVHMEVLLQVVTA